MDENDNKESYNKESENKKAYDAKNDTRSAYAKRAAVWFLCTFLVAAMGVSLYFIDNSVIYLVLFIIVAIIILCFAIKNLVNYSASGINANDKIYNAEFVASDYARYGRRNILFSIKVSYKNENGESCKGATDYCFSLDRMQIYQNKKKLKIAVKPNGQIIIIGLGG